MAVRTSERPEAPHASRINSVSSQLSDGPMPSPSARSSTSSWSEEPAQSNMDISTGHMVLVRPEVLSVGNHGSDRLWEGSESRVGRGHTQRPSHPHTRPRDSRRTPSHNVPATKADLVGQLTGRGKAQRQGAADSVLPVK